MQPVLLLTAALSLSLPLLVACGASEDRPLPTPAAAHAPQPALVLPAADEARRLIVGADPRIELLSVVALLGDGPFCGDRAFRRDTPYAQRALAHFEPQRGHEAVRMLADLRGSGFSCDALPSMALHLTAPPELAVAAPFSQYLVERAGSARRLERFAATLRNFAVESRFAEFYVREAPFYAAIAEAAERLSDGERNVRLIEAYYGMREAGYHLVLAPLINDEGYGPRVARPDGSNDVYSIVGPRAYAGELPSFGEAEDFRYLIWHEFSHSFVNPLTAQHREQVGRYERLNQPIAEQMRRQAYGSWETVVSEHLVRSVTTRLAERELGAAAGERALAYEQERGFRYLPALVERLKVYEQQRDRYPTFEDFFPHLLEVFAAELP